MNVLHKNQTFPSNTRRLPSVTAGTYQSMAFIVKSSGGRGQGQCREKTRETVGGGVPGNVKMLWSLGRQSPY